MIISCMFRVKDSQNRTTCVEAQISTNTLCSLLTRAKQSPCRLGLVSCLEFSGFKFRLVQLQLGFSLVLLAQTPSYSGQTWEAEPKV